MRQLFVRLVRPMTESILDVHFGSYFRDEEELMDYIAQYYVGWYPLSWAWMEKT